MDKKTVVDGLIVQFRDKAEETEGSFKSVWQDAVDAPGAMQSKSDTTKVQMSHIADSLYSSYEQINGCVAALESLELPEECTTVEIGTMVAVEEDQEQDLYFILPPECRSEIIEVEGQEITAVAANSPVAQAILGKQAGDSISFKVPQGTRTFKILEIA